MPQAAWLEILRFAQKGRRIYRAGFQEFTEQILELPIAPAIQIGKQSLLRLIALSLPDSSQSSQIITSLRRKGIQVLLRLYPEDIQVAHLSEGAPRSPQSLIE